MSEEPGRRFRKVMDKLYHAPRHNPQLSPSLPARGKKALEPEVNGALQKKLRIPASSSLLGPPPPCRPWDRGDLLRRLATFKAMTWFAKPKVVSSVNCARRGWINTEMDTIVCEACEARLLFSTPSSWTLQQVENAAAVFSLKLDNGHKLLCPWINNACDEALTLFPPTPPPVLIEGYKERCSSLLRLSALPLISQLAIDNMKSPQLGHFLSLSFQLSVTLEGGAKITGGYGSTDLAGITDTTDAESYYQALKLISLCGWEPRVLPYTIEKASELSQTDNNPYGSSFQPHGQKNTFTVYSSATDKEGGEGKNVHPNLQEFQYDPISVVFDCRLCGACVGLWAFTTVPRPLEIFSFIVGPDSSGLTALTSVSEAPRLVVDTEKQNSVPSVPPRERSMTLNLSIAGGPPPSEQIFKPRVSFPIISRILRARLSSVSAVRNSQPAYISCRGQLPSMHTQQDSLTVNVENNDGQLVDSSEDISSSRGKRERSESNGSFQNLEYGSGNGMISTSNTSKEPGSFSEDDGDFENQNKMLHGRSEGAQTVTEVSDSATVGGTSEAPVINKGVEGCEKDCMPESIATQIRSDCVTPKMYPLNGNEISKSNHEPSNVVSCSATDETLESTSSAVSEKCETGGFKNIAENSVNQVLHAKHVSGSNSKLARLDGMNGFDPIWQHRTFCPWVSTIDCGSMPGWKRTLSALCQENDFAYPMPSEAEKFLLNKADDPILSVRNLLSPVLKKSKH